MENKKISKYDYYNWKSLKLANAVFILVIWLLALFWRYTFLYQNPVIKFFCDFMLKASFPILGIVSILFIFYFEERKEKKAKIGENDD